MKLCLKIPALTIPSNKCQHCALAKVHSFMVHLVAERLLHILAIDFTLLEPTSNGLENGFVLTDVFSKFLLKI